MAQTLHYSTETNDTAADFTIAYIAYILGFKCIKITDVSRIENTDLYYGQRRPEQFKGIFIPENKTTLILSETMKALSGPMSADLSTDIIHAIYQLLKDRVNDFSEGYDKHERLKYQFSYQYIHHTEGYPLVNTLINHLKKLFERVVNKKALALWPEGKKCAVILSHDVDIPDKYAFLRHFKLFPVNRNTIGEMAAYYKDFLMYAVKYPFDMHKDNHWLFEQILLAEAQYGFNSSFFFAVRNHYDKLGHRLDVSYRIEDKKFAAIMKKIQDAGSEVGLHNSYNACRYPEAISEEKIKLEKISGMPVTGCRHHFWHLGKNYQQTIAYQQQAGLKYDSSFAFNDHIGFRHHTAWPYFIYDEKKQQRPDWMELPSFCMDSNFFDGKHFQLGAAEEVMRYVEMIRIEEGAGAINWHVRTSFPARKKYLLWANAYLEILKRLSEKEDIWVCSFRQVYEWLSQREKYFS